jgi:hypothetical protein
VSMPSMSSSVSSAQSPTRRFSRRRRREAAAAEARNLFLISGRTGVPMGLATESPAVMVLAVEDLCWQLAVAALKRRRPRIWQRTARAAWRTERARWDAKRQRLAAMAVEAVNEL